MKIIPSVSDYNAGRKKHRESSSLALTEASPGRINPGKRIGLKLLGAFLALGWASAGSAAFECPETGKGAVPALLSPAEEKLLAAGGEDASNEVSLLIVRLKA